MSKYDNLDAYTQLEQIIALDLASALGKRGLTVVHNGTRSAPAPGGMADLTVSNTQLVFTIEATKSKGAQQDRELNAIRDHLYQTKTAHPTKQCYCIYMAPVTTQRMLDGIRDYNQQRANEGKTDLKILPLSFEALELWTEKLRESEAALYPLASFIEVFNSHTEFIDDLRVKKLLFKHVFPLDSDLEESIEREETERDTQTLEALIRDLVRMENFMRENGIAVGHDAIDTLIYLVFIKLYEEKRERSGRRNRLRSKDAFDQYRQDIVDTPTRDSQRAIHELFSGIKNEGEFLSSRMFTPGDSLVDSVTDDFIMTHVIPMFSKYNFLGTRIDALGAVYEVLALRAEKDVKVGQFFTPENVVRFMVRLTDLDYRDTILDPACGTGRFLIYAMNDMLAKVDRSSERNKAAVKQEVRLHKLFGADIDQRIAKIAKMNMWVHGDGKANIFGGRDYNGLTLHRHAFDGRRTFDGAFDVVLTNPPLGELNYQSISFAGDANAAASDTSNDEKLHRMTILPRKNVTAEQLTQVRQRMVSYQEQLGELQNQRSELEDLPNVQEWMRLSSKASTKSERELKTSLELTQEVKAFKKVVSAITSKRKVLKANTEQETNLDAKQRAGQSEWQITGNTMKGGALFLVSIWHYLNANAYPTNLPEWQGGKLSVVLDEGILNTDNHKPTREFIRRHYYIKAIISLSRDTFVPVSKTSTKTSILYAVKKSDLDALQKEPIFYGHVERVGLDTKGRVCPNDFEAILARYLTFKEKVLASYVGLEFRKERFLAQSFEGGRL